MTSPRPSEQKRPEACWFSWIAVQAVRSSSIGSSGRSSRRRRLLLRRNGDAAPGPLAQPSGARPTHRVLGPARLRSADLPRVVLACPGHDRHCPDADDVGSAHQRPETLHHRHPPRHRTDSGPHHTNPAPAVTDSADSRFTAERAAKATRAAINSVDFQTFDQNLTTTGEDIEMTSRFLEPVLLGFAVLAICERPLQVPYGQRMCHIP